MSRVSTPFLTHVPPPRGNRIISGDRSRAAHRQLPLCFTTPAQREVAKRTPSPEPTSRTGVWCSLGEALHQLHLFQHRASFVLDAGLPRRIVDIAVLNPDGQVGVLYKGYTYLTDAPTISDISPSLGPSGGNQTVEITGTNFDKMSVVEFGSDEAIVLYQGDSLLRCYTPYHVNGQVNVTVTNPDEQSAQEVDGYTYEGRPPDGVGYGTSGVSWQNLNNAIDWNDESDAASVSWTPPSHPRRLDFIFQLSEVEVPSIPTDVKVYVRARRPSGSPTCTMLRFYQANYGNGLSRAAELSIDSFWSIKEVSGTPADWGIDEWTLARWRGESFAYPELQLRYDSDSSGALMVDWGWIGPVLLTKEFY